MTDNNKINTSGGGWREFSPSTTTDLPGDGRGLDPGEVTSKAHQRKISACERSLLFMQSASLKVRKPKTPLLHIKGENYKSVAKEISKPPFLWLLKSSGHQSLPCLFNSQFL